MSLTIDMSGKVAVITGATGGIGAGISRRFAEAGATVVIHYRSDEEGGLKLAEELGGSAVGADLASADGPASLVNQTMDEHGRIDALVNNAATQTLAPLADMSDDEWSNMITTNVTGVHRLTQVAAARMTEGGSVTHIASIEGTTPAPAHGHYAVSKAAVVMHAKAAALEWGERGIRVNSVSPGLISRPGIEEAWPEGVARWQAAAPLRRLGTPEDIGDACVFLASDMARWVTGINLTVDGGVSTHPSW